MSREQSPSLPVQVGELIAGKYRVDRLLGAGGMGVVVAATHLDLDRCVAVKLIREELAEDPAIVERLMLEAKAAAKIKSDHVGKVLDVGKLPSGVPYIVMEFLDGVDLCQLLEQHGALPITEAVDAVLQACEALVEAHQANIVHRDLKPENLFVARFADGSPNIKVLDFGISKQLGDSGRRALTNPASAVGSPQYMAPEQMQAGPVDVRVDVWALGAIIYELISNRQAFEGETLPEVCVKVLGKEPPPLSEVAPHVPDTLSAIVRRCLSKDRDLRFPSVAELVEELAPFGSDRATQSRNRIRGVISGSFVPVAGAAEGRPGSAPTMVAPTPSGGVAVSVATPEQWASGASGELTSRSAPRWPVFALLAGVVLVGGGLWVFSQSPAPTADPDQLTTQKTAVPASPPSPKVLTEEELREAAPTAPPPAADPPVEGTTSPPNPTVAPVVSAEAPRTIPTKKKRTRRPRKGVTQPKAKPGADAWDPDSFGGRR